MANMPSSPPPTLPWRQFLAKMMALAAWNATPECGKWRVQRLAGDVMGGDFSEQGRLARSNAPLSPKQPELTAVLAQFRATLCCWMS